MITVRFTYLTGLKRPLFHTARLAGTWSNWAEAPMTPVTADDGCPGFTTTVTFPDSDAGKMHRWGVRFDAPGGSNTWGINLEVPDPDSQDRYREFTLPAAGSSAEEVYYFTHGRRLGAQKHYPGGAAPVLRFSVWAPNAQKVDAVFGRITNGFIADDGDGIDPSKPVVSLQQVGGGIWQGTAPGAFSQYVGLPYMFRITNTQGKTVYRTDIHSRWQIGRGNQNPGGGHWAGDPDSLDGTVSCSVVIDQDVVRKEFEPTTDPPALIDDDAFWASEFTRGKPVPTRIEDLVVYELHVGSLGFGSAGPGTLADAIGLLDYLAALGVTAVELLPLSEFSGNLGWGYGDSHHFVIESSAGGRDKYKHFVRACHRRGIAVIQDVCYNHYDNNAARAEWEYDSTLPEQNIYYWYEGKSSDYPHPDGGYLNNGSSGFTPRFWEAQVRQMFISSAAQFVEEFHVDGLRVDLTQALHRDNTLNANGWGIRNANLFGQKFLREWSRTLRTIRPSVMLIAEDHTGWDAVTRMPKVGGLGFDVTWHAEFYHNLIGDSDMAGGAARVLRDAGFGTDGPLAMGQFAGKLCDTQTGKVDYHESHDEAGNAGGTARTSKVAVGGAALVGATREYAEARCRVVAGLSILSAGTPMFFMGEEIVAQKPCKFDNIAASKEDLHGERAGAGAKMFRYYQDLIRLRRANPAARSHYLDVIHAWDPSRVIAFVRRQGSNELLVVASLSNTPYDNGYVIETGGDRLHDGGWQETFNSDAGIYGGKDVGNFGAVVPASGGRIQLRLPANGLLVLQRR
jgi:1,4-alpha-glucan branching enzyme